VPSLADTEVRPSGSTRRPALHILVCIDMVNRCIHSDLRTQAGTPNMAAGRGCDAWGFPKGMAERGIYIRPCMLKSRALWYATDMFKPKPTWTNPRSGWRGAVALVRFLGIWRRREGKSHPPRFCLVGGPGEAVEVGQERLRMAFESLFFFDFGVFINC